MKPGAFRSPYWRPSPPAQRPFTPVTGFSRRMRSSPRPAGTRKRLLPRWIRSCAGDLRRQPRYAVDGRRGTAHFVDLEALPTFPRSVRVVEVGPQARSAPVEMGT